MTYTQLAPARSQKVAVARVKQKTKGQEASWLGKGDWAGPAALFFQMVALAFAAQQGAESWLTTPGVNTAALPPETQRASAGLPRADQVMKGPVAHQRAGCCVLGTGCCMLGAAAGLTPAPAFGTVPEDCSGVHCASGSGSQHLAAVP